MQFARVKEADWMSHEQKKYHTLGHSSASPGPPNDSRVSAADTDRHAALGFKPAVLPDSRKGHGDSSN
jgi:hypothetical protein